jgi:hypothetical protein
MGVVSHESDMVLKILIDTAKLRSRGGILS